MKMKGTIATLCIIAALFGNAAYASDLSDWAQADFESVASSGIMSYNVVKNRLSEDITREEFCEMIMNLFKNLSDKQVYTPEIFPFEDSDNIKVAQAYALGIISGRSDNEFDPQGKVTREEMAKIIVNTLKTAEVNLLTLKSFTLRVRLLMPVGWRLQDLKWRKIHRSCLGLQRRLMNGSAGLWQTFTHSA